MSANPKRRIKLRNCLFALGLILVASFAFAAPIDGKWAGEVQGMNVSYNFKADGDKLTGTSTSPDGKEIVIKDGKINGDNISFSVSIDMGGQEMKLEMKGVLSGDDLKLTLDMMGQAMDIPLKRVK
jgi:hypothetical protein